MTFTMDHAAVCFAIALAFALWDLVDAIWSWVRRDHDRMLWAPLYRYACGGARLGWQPHGCGAVLRYESTGKNGVEFWRCPVCGNPHWWRA